MKRRFRVLLVGAFLASSCCRAQPSPTVDIAIPGPTPLPGPTSEEPLLLLPTIAPSETKWVHLQKPKMLWNTILPIMMRDNDHHRTAAVLDQGNVLVTSPFDSNTLYATTSQGWVIQLSATTGTIMHQYHVVDQNVSCSSGVSFGTFPDSGHFVVVGLVQTDNTSSVVVALSLELDELWTTTIVGVLVGTPQVMQQGHGDTYIALTYNDNDKNEGYVVLLNSKEGQVVWSERAPKNANGERVPYGPATAIPSPLYGNYKNGQDNTNDLLVWTTSTRITGYVGLLQLPLGVTSDDQLSGNLKSQTSDKYSIRDVSVPPVLSPDGLDMYLGLSSDVVGWVHPATLDNEPWWRSPLVDATIDTTIHTISLSHGGNQLFVSTSSSQLHCLNSQTGQTLWTQLGTSPFLATPRSTRDDDLLLAIQSLDGRIYAYDQKNNGSVVWSAICDDFGDECADSVRADFALSDRGDVLYYGHVKGMIVALQLSEPPGKPTQSPTKAPRQPSPSYFPATVATIVPTPAPSVDKPRPSLDLQTEETTSTSLAWTAASQISYACGTLLLLCVMLS